MLSNLSGEKFRPVIVIRVPPKRDPVIGLISVMTISYLKSLAVAGLGTAFPDP